MDWPSANRKWRRRRARAQEGLHRLFKHLTTARDSPTRFPFPLNVFLARHESTRTTPFQGEGVEEEEEEEVGASCALRSRNAPV